VTRLPSPAIDPECLLAVQPVGHRPSGAGALGVLADILAERVRRRLDQHDDGCRLQIADPIERVHPAFEQDLALEDIADAYKVYMNLLWLGGAVGLGAGDEAGGADYKPRDVAYDILADQLQQLADAQKDFDRRITVDVPTFNKSMSGKIPVIKITK